MSKIVWEKTWLLKVWRDLLQIWKHVLKPCTWGNMLGLTFWSTLGSIKQEDFQVCLLQLITCIKIENFAKSFSNVNFKIKMVNLGTISFTSCIIFFHSRLPLYLTSFFGLFKGNNKSIYWIGLISFKHVESFYYMIHFHCKWNHIFDI